MMRRELMPLVVMSSAADTLPESLCLGPHFVGSLRGRLTVTQRCSAF